MPNRLTRAWKALTQTTSPELVRAVTADSVGYNRPLNPGMPVGSSQGYRAPARRYNYPTGTNTSTTPDRGPGRMSFDSLRSLIDAYDIAQICIQHRINDIRSLDWSIIPADDAEGDVTEAVRLGRAFMRRPNGVDSLGSFMAMWLRDILRYDAGALWKRRDRAGRVVGLDVVDGTTIKPLIDYYGRRPMGDAPAYQQYTQGTPWAEFTAADLIYQPFNPSSDSHFGMSPIEAVVLTGNTDLRMQMGFLRYFTEGAIPGGFGILPDDAAFSSPDKIAEFQDVWDALIAGDESMKHGIRWMPHGVTFEWPTNTSPDDNKASFSTFLMQKVCASYGVTPNDIGFTMDVNRATGDTQVDVQFRIGTLPLLKYVQETFTAVLQEDLGLPVQFKIDTGQEKEDRVATAQANKLYVEMGALSPDEVRSNDLGLPIDNNRPVPRFVMTTHAGPVPLVDLYDIAGPTDPKTVAPAEDQPLKVAPFAGVPGLMPYKPPGGQQFARAPMDPDDPLRPATEVPDPASGIVAPPVAKALGPRHAALITAAERRDLLRWRANTRTRIDRGQAPRDFTGSAIREPIRKAVWDTLQHMTDRPSADAVFEVVLDPKARPVTKSWRDDPDQPVAAHQLDLRLTDYWAPRIADAIAALFPAEDLAAAVLSALEVRKDDDGGEGEGGSEGEAAADDAAAEEDAALTDDVDGTVIRARVRQILGRRMSTDELDRIVRQAIIDAYTAGHMSAQHVVGDLHITPAGPAILFDWATWRPGNPDAAAAADLGGLRAMLDQAGVRIRGIADTTVDLIGAKVAAGLRAGDSIDTIGASLADVVADPGRAEMIAHTETARALTQSSIDVYADSGITQWDLVTANPCDRCKQVAAANPHPVSDEADQPPLHPRCRCAVSPHQ